jgi:farnesyl-diphosphate farnesyltransferase
VATHPQDREVIRLLRDVSRSFFLTVRILPRAVRPQIGLAYLLARATDTIADTEFVPPEARLLTLQQLRGVFQDPSRTAPPMAPYVAAGAAVDSRATGFPADATAPRPAQLPSAGEIRLLSRLEDILTLLETFAAADQELVRRVLDTITGGQELDLRRFANASSNQIVPLATAGELDDYTYRVAGCVGEFWTRLCRARLFPSDSIDDTEFLADGVRFGKGLQLVNILRDVPRDLRMGRCYFPLDQLTRAGLAPSDLLGKENENRFRPVYDAWLDRAHEHLAAGWNYTLAIPHRCIRLRLACAWPILIGVRTLAKLRSQPCLDPDRTIKIDRTEVRRLIVRSILLYPIPSRWAQIFTREGTSPSKPVASGGNFQ